MSLSSSQLGSIGRGMGYGGIGAGLAGLFMNNNNPAKAAMPYLNDIPGQTSQYYTPYIDAGKQALPQLQSQFGNLLNNPGDVMNKIGSSFHQSPGFQFALQQALRGSNNAAAAGGMLGSPQNQYQNMQLATQLGNQDYYNWLHPALGLYGQGLQGEQGLASGGLHAGSSFADMIAQTLAQKANLRYAGEEMENQNFGGALGNIASGAGLLAAFL